MRRLALLAVVGTSWTIAVLKFAGPTPKPTLLFSMKGHGMTGYTASPDGRRVYYWQDSTQLYVFDRVTRQTTRALDKMVAAGSGLAVSRAGNRLAFTRSAEGGGDQQVWTVALDSKTGLPNGTPKRASVLAASNPAFSPDGQSIVFATPTSRTTKNLVVIPVNGGPERAIVETQDEIWPVAWPKPDSVYFGLSSRAKERASKSGMYRVSVSSGKPPQFVVRTAGWGAYPGLSPDGRFIVAYDSTWDSVVVSTASGKRLHAYFDRSEEPTADIWATSARGIGALWKTLRAIHAVDLGSAQDRAISTSGELFAATWSPDGRRVASILMHPASIIISDAAGGSRVSIPVERLPGRIASMQWSPDGRFIGYFARGGLYLVDVRASTVRSLAPTASLGPLARWRADSRALIYAVQTPADNNTDAIKKIDIHEVALDGQDRVLHSFDARCRGGAFCGKIVHDSLVSTWINGEYRLTNFRARGTPRLVYTRDGDNAQQIPPVPTFSSNGRWMAVRHKSASDPSWSIELMHPDGSAHRSVQVPFRVSPGGRNPWIRDDGAELIVASPDCTPGASRPCAVGFTFYRVDVATGKATMMTSVAHTPGASDDFMISDDGRSLVYVREVEKGVDFYDLDFTGMLVDAKP